MNFDQKLRSIVDTFVQGIITAVVQDASQTHRKVPSTSARQNRRASTQPLGRRAGMTASTSKVAANIQEVNGRYTLTAGSKTWTSKRRRDVVRKARQNGITIV